MFKTGLEFRSFDIRICFGFRYSDFEFENIACTAVSKLVSKQVIVPVNYG